MQVDINDGVIRLYDTGGTDMLLEMSAKTFIQNIEQMRLKSDANKRFYTEHTANMIPLAQGID